MILEILEEINESNSTNYKISVLKKHADNKILQTLLKMTYDTVAYNYYITMKNVEVPTEYCNSEDLEWALEMLDAKLSSREVTGNAAREELEYILSELSEADAKVIQKVIDRDLKLNIGRTQINKVWKDLVVKPVYCRCDTYGEKTKKNISFPAMVQLKADGTYREFHVRDGKVTANSRSGEQYDYPIIFEQMVDYPNGHYTGELTVRGIADRAEGNGLINSSNPPHEDIILELWDYITEDEYKIAGLKDRKNPCVVPYNERFKALLATVTGDVYPESNLDDTNIKLIPHVMVDNISEALKVCSGWMSEGYEGAILKDTSMVFKDGTSKHQLKLKLEIDLEVRCTGFLDGKKGTKREATFGGMLFENDEGTIKGSTSGFTDKQLEDFNSRREELIGKVFTVQFNDLTKGRDNDYHALSHPRFIEFRDDKDETDTLEKAFKLKEMSMELS